MNSGTKINDTYGNNQLLANRDTVLPTHFRERETLEDFVSDLFKRVVCGVIVGTICGGIALHYRSLIVNILEHHELVSPEMVRTITGVIVLALAIIPAVIISHTMFSKHQILLNQS